MRESKAFAAHVFPCDKPPRGVPRARRPSSSSNSSRWIRIAREQQAERDDADAAMDAPRRAEAARAPAAPTGVRFPPRSAAVFTLMSAADGVDALRADHRRRVGDVDDALMAMLTGNADNAEAAGDDGRAKFLRKVAEVCVRERNNANGGGA